MKTAQKITRSSNPIRQLVREVQLLRSDIALLLPKESLKEYRNKSEILASFARAKKQFPA